MEQNLIEYAVGNWSEILSYIIYAIVSWFIIHEFIGFISPSKIRFFEDDYRKEDMVTTRDYALLLIDGNEQEISLCNVWVVFEVSEQSVLAVNAKFRLMHRRLHKSDITLLQRV